MKIKYLGTAAAEGIPALGCRCDVCRRARAAGGRNMRSRSQALVDGKLLIEFNADTVWHSFTYGFDFDGIEHCLISHSHGDHLYVDDIEMFRPDFCHGRSAPMTFYAADDGYRKIESMAGRAYMRGAVRCVRVKEGERFTAGKYSVLPLGANHDPASSPVIYLVERDGKRLLYAHDTGVFPEQTKRALTKEGKLSLVSLDCTGGADGYWRDGHMSFASVLETVEFLRKENLIDDTAKIVVNHFSHNGKANYDDMVKLAQGQGIAVSYDGLEIEF